MRLLVCRMSVVTYKIAPAGERCAGDKVSNGRLIAACLRSWLQIPEDHFVAVCEEVEKAAQKLTLMGLLSLHYDVLDDMHYSEEAVRLTRDLLRDVACEEECSEGFDAVLAERDLESHRARCESCRVAAASLDAVDRGVMRAFLSAPVIERDTDVCGFLLSSSVPVASQRLTVHDIIAMVDDPVLSYRFTASDADKSLVASLVHIAKAAQVGGCI
eukprot:518214-Rhodomonas_salina.2